MTTPPPRGGSADARQLQARPFFPLPAAAAFRAAMRRGQAGVAAAAACGPWRACSGLRHTQREPQRPPQLSRHWGQLGPAATPPQRWQPVAGGGGRCQEGRLSQCDGSAPL